MDAERAPLPVEGVIRFYNLLPHASPFLATVLAGLARPQKSIPPKYFYDERGSRLFEEICALPEYYLTRTELAVIQANVVEIAQFIGPDVELIELGSGAGIKTRLLIERLLPPVYVPIDIDGETLRSASNQLAEIFPWLNVVGLCADYTLPLELPQFAGLQIRRNAVFFPGSTVGNFTPEEALGFMKRVRRMAGSGGALLIGVDLKKDKATLDAAYDDAAGVTAKFNLNLLERINRELGGDFKPERFRHKAFYDPIRGWVEMHIESQYAQLVQVGGKRFEFAAGETIHTEISCKYSIGEFQDLAKKAGFSPQKVWTDPRQLFSVHGMLAV
jgi:dimethylhistidine N-methyltransferase